MDVFNAVGMLVIVVLSSFFLNMLIVAWFMWKNKQLLQKADEAEVEINIDLTGSSPYFDKFFVKKWVKLDDALVEKIRRVHHVGPYPEGVRPRLSGPMYEW